MTTTLMVVNKNPTPANLQLRPFKWDQIGGTDNLKATAELAVSPPMTEVPAGETQTFRVVLRQSATTTQASYRLLLDQLPGIEAPGSVRVILRFSIPVFADPASRTEAKLDWRVTVDQSGASLIGTNHGTAHVRVVNPTLSEAQGPRLSVAAGQSPYILPGAERTWHIQTSAPLRPGSTLHLVATSDGGPIDATVRVSPP